MTGRAQTLPLWLGGGGRGKDDRKQNALAPLERPKTIHGVSSYFCLQPIILWIAFIAMRMQYKPISKTSTFMMASWLLFSGDDAECVEWFLEDQAFSPSYEEAPPPWSERSTGDTQKDWERETTWWREMGWARSQIIRRRENLYKSFNTLWDMVRRYCTYRTSKSSRTTG